MRFKTSCSKHLVIMGASGGCHLGYLQEISWVLGK